MTASFGVAAMSPEGSTAQLLKACESAVELARTDGGDRVVHLEVAAENAALARYYPGKEVGQAGKPDKAQSQAGKPDKAQSQAGKPDLQCVSFVPGG